MAEFLTKTKKELSNECANCFHLRGYISLWCKNKSAVKAYGTNLRGSCGTVRNCKWFIPQRTISEALQEDYGYVKKENAGFLRKIFRYNIVEYANLEFDRDYIIRNN